MILYDVLNEVTALATAEPFHDEVRKAREEYFSRTGPVNEEDLSFEPRMSLFLEWFLFDRPCADQRLLVGGNGAAADAALLTPLDYFIAHPPTTWQGEEHKVVSEFKNNRHSIFEFSKIKENMVAIVDFAGLKKIDVMERRGTSGFLKGAIFEARLLSFNSQYHFSGPMLFHPHGTRKFIRKTFKANTMPHNDVLFMLSAMALKCDRYKHVPQDRIYCEGDGSGNLKL